MKINAKVKININNKSKIKLIENLNFLNLILFIKKFIKNAMTHNMLETKNKINATCICPFVE